MLATLCYDEFIHEIPLELHEPKKNATNYELHTIRVSYVQGFQRNSM